MAPPPDPLDHPTPHHPHGHHPHRRSSTHGIHGNPFILTLNEKQQAALAQFKALLEGKGAYVPPAAPGEGEEGGMGRPGSVDDLMLIRFLKARRWDPQAATQQFLATIDWRKKHNVDTLFREEVDPMEYESWKQTYPKWTGRRDKHGNPLYVYKLAVLTSSVLKELGKVPEEVRYRRIVALYELLHNLAFPLCLSVPITPPLLPPGQSLPAPPEPPAPLPPNSIRLIQNTTIIDFTGTTLGSMFSFRHHLAQASTLAQANHPETLGSIFVVGAPGWWSTVWGWIKNWFDEQTRAKVHIVAAGSPELLNIIPRENLPKAYGGELDWVYEDDPLWDADMEWHLQSVGAPQEGGVSRLRGPVVVTPRTGERDIKVELVGRGRHEVLVPKTASSSAAAAPAAAGGTAGKVGGEVEIPRAEGAETLPITPGGPMTPAANLAPADPMHSATPSDPSMPTISSPDATTAPSLAQPTPAPVPAPPPAPAPAEAGSEDHQEAQESAARTGGFLPPPMGPGLGPPTPGTPGFVPNLTGAVLGPAGTAGSLLGQEGAGDGEEKKGDVEGLVEKVEAVKV